MIAARCVDRTLGESAEADGWGEVTSEVAMGATVTLEDENPLAGAVFYKAVVGR